MAAPAPLYEVKDKDCINFKKVTRALIFLKYAIVHFIESEMKSLHTYLRQKIHGDQMKPLHSCTICNSRLVSINEYTGDWELQSTNQCQSKCNIWFQELLELHVNPRPENIDWENCDIPSWPSKPWECAKVFIELTHYSISPANCSAKGLLLLLSNCKHFCWKLSPHGHGLLQRVITIPKKMMSNGSKKLLDVDTEQFIQEIILLLEDPVNLKSRVECKDAVDNIKKLRFLGQPNVPSLFDLVFEHGQNQQTRHRKQFQGLLEHTAFSDVQRLQIKNICIPYNPKCGQIIKQTVDYMERNIAEKIGGGKFGDVFKAKMKVEDHEFVIKKIKSTEEFNRKAYEREIYYGGILHPFIQPIYAYAESPKKQSEGRYLYLMSPHMKNKDLHCNIDIENSGMCLSVKESNSQIWTRCTYQLVEAVYYLHTNVKPFRGLIFHCDLTSKHILLDANYNIRIGDFGNAVDTKLNASKVTLALKTNGYHPSDTKYTASDDIFSVGVVLLEMLTGEMPVPEKGSKYLHEKFANLSELKRYLNQRSKENKSAKWGNIRCRNKIAKIALDAVGPNMTKRKAEYLQQELKKLRLTSTQRYRCPKDLDVCVSCCINPTVKLPLKGEKCLENEKTDPCQPYCLHCLMNYLINPLVCPKHGKTRPPFGDHVYGVFVAGNNVEGMQAFSRGSSDYGTVANIFKSDAKKFVKALKVALYQFDLESRKDDFKIVRPNKPGTEDEMMTRMKQAFTDLVTKINTALKDRNMEPDDRLPSSLFIFYFSGHCTIEDGLYLGSKQEIINASTTWLMEMLHEKLRVEQVLVVLDSCHANSIDFIHFLTQGMNKDAKPANSRSKVRIIQLSSSDVQEKSQAWIQGGGSAFTHLLCQGLQGLDINESNNDVISCDSCKKCNIQYASIPCRLYDTQCSTDQIITLFRLVEYVRGHLKLLEDGNVNMTPILNSQGQIDLCMGYYILHQSCIFIHLSASEGTHVYSCRKPYPDKIERLKRNIIKYTVKKQITCDVHLFHESYKKSCEDTSHIVGIYAKNYNNMDMELNSSFHIYNAWVMGLRLEARVRENVVDLCHGPVKLNQISKSAVKNLDASPKIIVTDSLQISSDVIQIPADKIAEADDQIKKLFSHHQVFVDSIGKVLSSCIDSLTLKQKDNKVLQFLLHDKFSFLNLV